MNDVNATPAGGRSPWNLLSSGANLPIAAEIGALLLRGYFGFAIFWGAGLSKFPLDAWFAPQVEAMGFPLPTLFAWAAAMSEVAGGVLLVLGLATRPAAFFLACTLGVAAFGFHKIPFPGYTSQHITLLYFWGYVLFTFAGAGRLSLDGLLRRRGAVAAGLAVVVVAALSVYCGARTAPEPEETTPQADPAEIASVSLAGSFNEWDLAATPMDEAETGVWVATVQVDRPEPVEFKFVANGTWDAAAGESDQPTARFPVAGVAELGPNAGNIAAYLPVAGAYRFRIELPTLAYSVTGIDGAGEPAAPPNE